MAVQVYGCNHVVIEVDDAEKAVQFYSDVFNLDMLRGGAGASSASISLWPSLRSKNCVLTVSNILA